MPALQADEYAAIKVVCQHATQGSQLVQDSSSLGQRRNSLQRNMVLLSSCRQQLKETSSSISRQSDNALRERRRKSHLLEELVSHRAQSYKTNGTLLPSEQRLSLQGVSDASEAAKSYLASKRRGAVSSQHAAASWGPSSK
ncbi:hypothetical protein ABBQ32_013366 [Trebouxia sp. C0010 RCD-2024]